MDMINLFEKESTVNAILYITEKSGGVIDVNILFKLLYFADRESLCTYCRTITRDVYIAGQHGPIPSKTTDILKAVRDGSFADNCFHFVDYYTIANDIGPNMAWLSQSDVICLDRALEKCKGKGFCQLVELSKGEAWHKAERDGRMCFSDIMREVGCTEEYIDYVEEQMQLICYLRS